MSFIVLAFFLLAANAVHGYFNDTELRQHVAFFDRDQDGILHVEETVEGFKALGLGHKEAITFAKAIHTRFRTKTLQAVGSGFSYPIVVNNIKLARGTSKTSVYDHKGRFMPEKFEAIFAKYSHKKPNALDLSEINKLLEAKRQPCNNHNWLAASAEWKLLYRLGKDADGFLTKQNVKKVYDGFFFRQLAANISISGTKS